MSDLRIVADANMPGLDGIPGLAVDYQEGRSICREHLENADALLVRSVTRVDENLLAGTGVRFVGTATSGFDHVDRVYLADAGIGFSHAPGSNANSVVEYVLAAIATIGDFLEQLLAGEKVGVVGYGHIGKLLCQRLTALKIDFCCYDPWLDDGSVANACSLDKVLASRVITLHPSLTLELPWPSRHLLSTSELAQITAGQLLINASRGEVVDNRALALHLRDQPEAPVVLDVWEGEPALDPRLLDQVAIGTAHIAGYSLDSKLKATRMLLTAMAGHLAIPELSPGNLEDGAEEFTVDLPGQHAQALRSLLGARYQIMEDDRRLRAAADMAAGDSRKLAASFDRLRKDYPVRRELAGSRVHTTNGSAADLLRALDCMATGDR